MRTAIHFFVALVLASVCFALLAALFVPAVGRAVFAPFFRFRLMAGLRSFSLWLRKSAFSIHRTGHAFCMSLLNRTLRKSGGHPFGARDETIRSALSLNKQSGTLTAAGRWLVWALGVADSDHAVRSIGK